MEVFNLEYPNQIYLDDIQEMMSLAIGYFDGVHRGHQEVIGEAKRVAQKKGYKSAVMTFHPHPSVVLSKQKKEIHYITPKRDKMDQFEQFGIDYVFIVRFNEALAQLEPQQFVDEFLIKLGVKHLVAGFDFSYGHKGKGTMNTIEEHSRGMFTFSTIDKITHNEEKISSTAIREKISTGKMEEAHQLLGRPYHLRGTVIQGDKRGRTLGFPTTNIELSDDYYLPKAGVYAVKITVSEVIYDGMANIGYKPTFNENEGKPSIEVYIFDFSGNIYGKEVVIDLFHYIRGEQKFSSIEELKSQLHNDEERIRHFFAISS
ncbi:riboflavin kinase / FMN adenylyltransferase [Salinibacillus kushneri]|uniref:Riboflavin biosynthesis protein n=1 Tax=Salinibacillus kushneri TaxID=237682 RepID=A0A1I0E7R3_9BACI|nr:riboflavin biosynthesis protein RibF [Salinibacillus kushneri]SET40320.1 riboflavin kinase / FMN adenylyltransferase [Salinibacillus kushneri]